VEEKIEEGASLENSTDALIRPSTSFHVRE